MGEGGDVRSRTPEVDTNRPSGARVYDLFLGGKNSFEIDRQLYRQILKIAPETPELAKENRRWLAKVVDLMARDRGIDQFLDLGSGLPTSENTHEVAQKAAPDVTVVYVDNDPTVISHGQALLADEWQRVYFAAADLTEPAAVLSDPTVTGALDLNRPVGLIQCLVLHCIADLAQARGVVAGYVDALPAGSYLAVTHATNPRDGSRLAEFATSVEDKVRTAFPSMTFRTADEIASLFTGLELVGPGLAGLGDWWPTDGSRRTPGGASRLLLGGLARKP
ncbi:S-adenosyl methyltransferase [Kribbella orskensis]|uniref:S-adenosyl methyltransferase n=1 Tax=Kribbella orskensis TaxID=2512216 RepID=A0ABY2B9H9_9ACTN|nr:MULTISPECIES: SAM-dependent methyltransferase [Kribbella]TCN31723.1 S-adenosyl methyltransferase [Kribbella sp. VKM Ac-2500]TCO12271.1 S-adenosyl methyltransferase [Kribbella orskensis]